MARLIRKMTALDPFGESQVSTRIVGLEQSQIDVLVREDGTTRDKVRLGRLVLAKEVVQDPIVVFVGLERPNTDDGLCYCGRPKRDFRGPSIETPAPPSMVFCVFTQSSGKMIGWRWEPCDRYELDYPEDWKNRFRGIAWPSTLTT